MDKLLPPPALQLNGNTVADNWKRFKQRYNFHMNTGEMSQKDEKMKSSLLLHVIREKRLDVYNTFKFDDVDDSVKLKKII